MLSDLITLSNIKENFSESVFKRALTYYEKGRVKNFSHTPINHKSEKIAALVKGKHVYNVEITLRKTSSKLHIQSYCSCPVKTRCKHVVATLLKVIDNANVAESYEVKIPKDPRLEFWLQELKNSIEPKEHTKEMITPLVDETHCLIYLLSSLPYPPYALQLQLVIVRRLKKGGYGRYKEYSNTNNSHQRYLYPIDQKLIETLEIIQFINKNHVTFHRYSIEGEMAEKMLPEIIATKRCHWDSAQNPPLTLCSSKMGNIHWRTLDDGFQEICFAVENQRVNVCTVKQLWFIDTHRWEIGPLETGLDLKLSMTLLKAPKIAPHQVDEIQSFLKKNDKMSIITAPKIFKKAVTMNKNPVCLLKLFQENIAFTHDEKPWEETSKLTAVAELSFIYDDYAVSWLNDKPVINVVGTDIIKEIVRNLQYEKNALQLLFKFGTIPLISIYEISEKNRSLRHLFLVGAHTGHPLDFTLYAIPDLLKKGWKIEIAEDYPFQIIDTEQDEWYSNVEENTGYDWFGLELGIIIKNEKINLLPILQSILAKKLFKNEEGKVISQPVLAQLPSGKYIKLLPERINSILNVLVELYDNNSLSENKLRLSLLDSLRLVELEKALAATNLRWFGGNKLREVGKKISQFKQIEQALVPAEFQGNLRSYQHEGLSWLQFLREYNFGGILADDMGLGKTIQALAHLTVEKISGRMNAPCLIVAPTSLMFNWRLEAERFSPSLKLLVLHGTERKECFNEILNYDIILTTYPLLYRDKEILLEHHFYLLILDEAQCIKNTKSLTTQIALQLKASHRLCLSGTPMENHLSELWSLFNFMMPGLLGEQAKFKRLFQTPIEKHGDLERKKHLAKRIAPFLLRRTKDIVAKELPAKVEIIHEVELEDRQRDIYETLRVSMQEKVRREIKKLGLARSHIVILDALLKLRQICCDPTLLKIDLGKKKNVKSAKLELLMTMLPELLEEGRRILLFSQFTEMLSIIENKLVQANISYVKLTGQTKNRETIIESFQSGSVSLFLISLKAGGVGLNLTTADTVIHYDPWWNPAVENQATDRAHRIGQQKTVFVYKLITKNTIEEKILKMQKNKASLTAGLFTEKSASKANLTEHDFQALFEAY